MYHQISLVLYYIIEVSFLVSAILKVIHQGNLGACSVR